MIKRRCRLSDRKYSGGENDNVCGPLAPSISRAAKSTVWSIAQLLIAYAFSKQESQQLEEKPKRLLKLVYCATAQPLEGWEGGLDPPPQKKMDGPPQLFDEECDYPY